MKPMNGTPFSHRKVSSTRRRPTFFNYRRTLVWHGFNLRMFLRRIEGEIWHDQNL